MQSHIIALALLATTGLAAPLVVIWDSRETNAPPATSHRLIDAGRTDHPDFRPVYRSAPAPLLWDMADDTFVPWTPGAGDDDLAASRTNRYTDAQRRVLRDLVQIGTNYGLTAQQVRREPYRVLRVTLRNSETNTAVAATRQLARTVGLLEALKRTQEDEP